MKTKNKKNILKTKKRLYKSSSEKILGGVCGGIAQYLDTDPTIVRLLWVIFTLFYGAGLILYIILWIIMPLKK